MKNIKNLILLFLSMTFVTACFDDSESFDLNAEGVNVVTFDKIIDNMTGVAEKGGAEYTFLKKVKIVGPTVANLTSDITVTVQVVPSTANSTMYRINNPTFVLKAKDNYLGLLSITMTTLGNEPPAEGTPEAETYKAPVLKLKLNASGDSNVVGSGKIGEFTLNFTPPNPYAGDYDVNVLYYHPAFGTYPNNIRNDYDKDVVKTLVGLTARRGQVNWFGPYEDYISFVTINSDYTATFENTDWGFDIKQGDPYRPDLVSHFDPVTKKIYLYYHYVGGTGFRIFWEEWTPKF